LKIPLPFIASPHDYEGQTYVAKFFHFNDLTHYKFHKSC